MREKNKDMNVIDGNALIYDCEDCVIKGPEDRLIVVQGLKNYLIATCDNVILICDKNNEKQFRTFVQDVKDLKGDQFL